MFIPIGTDNPLRKKPRMNHAIILLNFAIVFLFGFGTQNNIQLRPYLLNPDDLQLYQFVTSAFLHGNWMHIIGNMLFLLIFGANVNDKLGHLGYLLFYLAAAICSGIGHVLISDMPVLGASGAIAAVTGAYMVLFPKTYIHVLYVIFFIGTLEVPALYFILFKLVIFDNVIEPKLYGGGNVAHSAHLAGYVFGMAIPLIMITLRLIPHSQYDLWALLKRWRRRQIYRSTVGKSISQNPKPYRHISVEVTDSKPLSPEAQYANATRNEIADAIYRANLDEAVEKYLELIEKYPQQVLPQQHLLDIANKLMQIGKYPQAANAYEQFLQHYQKYPFIEQIQLMLGLIYSRYLQKPELARNYLQKALEKLQDPNQVKMCRDELKRQTEQS